MTIKNKKREVLLMRTAGESWQHRRHKTSGKVLKSENGIQKKQILQQIIEAEHNEELKKLLTK